MVTHGEKEGTVEEQPPLTGYHVRPTPALMDGRVPPWLGLNGMMHLIETWLDAVEAGRSAIEFMCRGAEVVGGLNQTTLSHLQEAVFEHVRRTEFPDLAPRLGSVMSFPTIERCRMFAQQNRAQYGRLYYYEVATAPPQPEGARVTTVDMALYTVAGSFASLRQFFDPAVAQAHLYWGSASRAQQDPEILMYGAVKAVREVASA